MNKCCSSASTPIVSEGMQDLKWALSNNSHNSSWIALRPQCPSLKLRQSGWRLTSLISTYQWLTFPSCWVFYTYVRYLLDHTPTPPRKVLSWTSLCVCAVYEAGFLRALFRICWIYPLVTIQASYGRKDMKSSFASVSEYRIPLAFKNTLCRYINLDNTSEQRVGISELSFRTVFKV